MEIAKSALRGAGFYLMAAVTAVMLFAITTAPPDAFGASVYIVDTTADDPAVTLTACTGAAGDCSLRGAMTNANAASTPGDLITFDTTVFPSGAPATITLSTILPLMSGGGDTLDGTGAGVIIDATGETPSFTCLSVPSAGNTVKGLQFTDCTNGIALGSAASDNNVIGPDNIFFDNIRGIFNGDVGATGNSIVGNKVGTNAAGTAIPAEGGNTEVGILIFAANNTIGGTDLADRNIISGNPVGLYLLGSDATGNEVYGNFIGTDVTGLVDLGNSSGVLLQGAVSNTIGGTTTDQRNLISGNFINVSFSSSADNNTVQGNFIGPDINSGGALVSTTGIQIASSSGNTIGPGNVISDNGGDGVNIAGSPTMNNVVKGNLIGTDVAGTQDVGNARGVQISGGSGNIVGGANPGDGNVISGNTFDNVLISGDASDSNVVSGNIIGPDINGSGAAMTNGDNVRIASSADDNTIGPGNVISDASGQGVFIQDAGTTGNIVKGNKIGTNLAGTAGVPNFRGINIGAGTFATVVGGDAVSDGNLIAFNSADGILINSATDNPIRRNSIHDNVGLEIDLANGGNFEIAAPVITAAGANAVGGTACMNCEVDVFSDGASDAEFYEGSATADGTGNWVLYAPVNGPNVTATNTDATGNTSELSSAVGFTAPDGDGDGVPNTLDNCPANPDGSQTDTDSDGAGDACDTDDDDDSLADGSDGCPVLAEDFDGFEDTDGCPDPDNDADGICDAGQASLGCTGSDTGKMCFDPAATLTCDTIDCRNVAEDIDAFKDSDGCPEPDNDNDGFPDGTDECPGTDSLAGADGMLGSPQDANHNGVQDGAEPSHSTDDVELVFEDYDGVIDFDGCHDSPGDDYDGDGLTDEFEVFTLATLPYNPDTDADSHDDGADNCPRWANAAQNVPAWPIPANDADCDGFSSQLELTIGTDPTRQCPVAGTPDAWPVDITKSGNVNIADVTAFKPVFLQSVPPGPARFDLNASGAINIADVTLLKPFFLQSCTP